MKETCILFTNILSWVHYSWLKHDLNSRVRQTNACSRNTCTSKHRDCPRLSSRVFITNKRRCLFSFAAALTQQHARVTSPPPDGAFQLSGGRNGGSPAEFIMMSIPPQSPQLEPHVERLQREGNSAEASTHTADTSSVLKLEGFSVKKRVFHSASQTRAIFTPTSSMFN